MKYLHLDLARMGAVVIREVPTPRMQADKTTPLTNANGEQVYAGRVLIPGVARSLFADPLPGQVRLKIEGNPPPADLVEGSVVRLTGTVKLSSWYQRGGRGSDATSSATLTPDGLVLATGERPQLTGLVPVSPPVSDPFTALAFEQADDGWDLTAMVPQAVVDQAGVVKVRLAVRPADDLIGMPIRFDGLMCKVVQPDVEDIGRNAKAELILSAASVTSAALVSTGAPRRGRVEPEQTEATE